SSARGRPSRSSCGGCWGRARTRGGRGMNDKISALMDGELDEKSAAEMIDWLGRDGEALHAWRAYHLISDAMRDSCMLSDGFAAHVAARLSAEPALLAPATLQAESRQWLLLPAPAPLPAVS